MAITLDPGVVHAIVGPNGSGKTTLLNLLSGFITSESGTIRLGDDDIRSWSPPRIAQHGVARSFQTPRLVLGAPALANIEFGALPVVPCGDSQSFLALPAARAADREVRRRARAAAELLGLDRVLDIPAGLLPHGTQRLVEVARALAAEPNILLLDEPAAGLSQAETGALLDAVAAVAAGGVGVALIEHNLPVVFGSADFVTVLDNGRVLVRDSPAEVSAHPEVRRAYLGSEQAGPVRRAASTGTVGEELLAVRGLRAGYGGMTAVAGVDLEVRAGELVALIGRNGAGKTTALHAIAGLRRGSNAGVVTVGGRDLSKAAPSKVANAGLALVPEGKRIFTQMSVRDNLLVGLSASPTHHRAEEQARMGRVLQLFPLLEEAIDRTAGDLSGGGQQMVAIGQALMGAPRVLLLDEPASGLAPTVVDELMGVLRTLADDGLGVLFVDQSVERALACSDRIYTMDNGRIALSGSSAEVLSSELVRIIVGPVPAPATA
ncbi:MAG TPA: ATP-binding cassette domain-containing protein [Acidimicrobiales bacterium]|nr:ATP-binding cassette domain-containing protein [Acidimicrobiales bacterium]